MEQLKKQILQLLQELFHQFLKVLRSSTENNLSCNFQVRLYHLQYTLAELR